jgi:Na+-driven multidrug efflux pump
MMPAVLSVNASRAKRIAWTGSFVGAGIAGSIGLIVAIFPVLWLHFFSHDPQALAAGSTYLRIVAPAYGALGFAGCLCRDLRNRDVFGSGLAGPERMSAGEVKPI